MDTLIVSHRSALTRWGEKDLGTRLGEPLPAQPGWRLPRIRSLDEGTLRRAGLEARPERPLHVLARNQMERVRSDCVVPHVWSGPLPDGAFYQLAPGVLLCSPSFCLRQLCSRVSPARAAATVMEACGGYALSAAVPQGFLGRPPLVGLEELRSQFRGERGYGTNRVREAIELALPGSRSPMETVVALFFSLPPELGGCGLPQPQVNVRVEIPADLQMALGKPYLVVDMCWPDQRIVLEYDSYTWHLVPRAFDGTQSRNEGLRDEGWMVRTVTSGILRDPGLRQLLVCRVLARFGLSDPDDGAYLIRRELLVRDLLSIRGA